MERPVPVPAPAPDSPLDPLLERLAFLETANDGLKTKLSAGGFNAALQNLGLREQLEHARAEVSRQQEALNSFYREILAAAQARDRAQAAAEESIAAREAAVQERDALRSRLGKLEDDLERARRGALDDDARRRVDDLEAALERARRGAQEAELTLQAASRTSLQEAQAGAEQRLRALTAEFSEREARLLKTLDEERRLLGEAGLELETAQRRAQVAESSLREASRKADDEAAARQRMLAKEFADREAALLNIVENDRRLIEALKTDLERARGGEAEAARALRESDQKAQAEAEQRFQLLAKASADREVLILKEGEDERRRLAELAIELERTSRAGKEAEAALRESSRAALHEAEERRQKLTAEFAEREAMLLKTAENDRRRLELELSSRDAKEADRVYRESQRKTLPVLQAEFAGREALILKQAENDRRNLEAMEIELRRRDAAAAEREAQHLATAESDRRRLNAMRLELERTLSAAQESARILQESHQKAQHAAETEAADRLRSLANEITAREALFLKTNADDRKLLAELKLELDLERAARKADGAPTEAPEFSPESALTPEEGAAAAPFISPALEPLLDPGWARLLRLVRPPVEAAYAHLRRLSSTALTAGQKTLLRMAAASIASASDSLSSVELSLEDGPAPAAPSPLLPVLDSSLTAWEPAFRGRGVALTREFIAPLPETAHSPKELRIALHHVLRNVLEAVPRGGRLAVRAARAPDGGLRVDFTDDGPGFPAEWLARRFEPFAAPRRGRAGLGLSIVRRTLRRWGGDAEAANIKPGRGAKLTLLFAPPPPPASPLK